MASRALPRQSAKPSPRLPEISRARTIRPRPSPLARSRRFEVTICDLKPGSDSRCSPRNKLSREPSKRDDWSARSYRTNPLVILSGVTGSRSEAVTQSKGPRRYRQFPCCLREFSRCTPHRNSGCHVLALFARAGSDAAGAIWFVMPHGLHRTYRVHHLHFITGSWRVKKLRYMHHNPVKQGLARAPEQWRWSSYRFYLFGRSGPVRVSEGGRNFLFRAPAA